MKRGTVVGFLVLGILFSGMPAGWGQNNSGSQDYQYVLIDALKYKNLGQLAEAVMI